MLLGCEAVVALRPEAMALDIVIRVSAIRHLIERNIRNLSESLAEFILQIANDLLSRSCDVGLKPRHLFYELGGPSFIPRPFCFPDFLRNPISFFLPLLN